MPFGLYTLATIGGTVVGGVGAVVAAPVVLGAVGFTAGGIAAGSWAAGMMSSAAIANGGAIAAGSTVAVLQSIGAAGLGAAGTAAVAGTGAAVGGSTLLTIGALIPFGWYTVATIGGTVAAGVLAVVAAPIVLGAVGMDAIDARWFTTNGVANGCTVAVFRSCGAAILGAAASAAIADTEAAVDDSTILVFGALIPLLLINMYQNDYTRNTA